MEASWMEAWGPWVVLLGAVLEGETVLVAAGYAVSQGHLPPLPTLTLAILGATLGDHLFYLLGRYWGAQLFRRVAALRRLRARAILALRRWGRLTAFATRFAYGLRVAMAASMGAARYPFALFSPFNVLGATVFASLYLSLGYFFGEAVEEILGRTRGWQLPVLVGIAAAGALIWIIREWRLFHSGPADGDGPGGGAALDDPTITRPGVPATPAD